MKDQQQKAAAIDETKPLETTPTAQVPDGDETQRLRALTIQEIEHILKGEPLE